jgi:hypothetical protein
VRELQSLCLDVELIEEVDPEAVNAGVGEVLSVGVGIE